MFAFSSLWRGARDRALVIVALGVAGGMLAATVLAAPASAAPISGTQVVSASVTVAANQAGVVTITCPAGTTPTGGGFGHGTLGHPGDLVLRESRPVNGNQWRVWARNVGATSQSLTGYTVCSSGQARTYPSASFTVPAGGFASGTAGCASGVSTGGGFSFPSGADEWIVADRSAPAAPGQGWSVRVRNHSGVDRTVTVFAVCGDVSGRSVVTASAVAGPDNNNPYITADCPTGMVTTGGGWAHGAPNHHLWQSIPVAANGAYRRWQLRFYWYQGDPSYAVTVYSICASGS
jgi:hypothetical protein